MVPYTEISEVSSNSMVASSSCYNTVGDRDDRGDAFGWLRHADVFTSVH